ncbi:MAG: type II secretion system protein [Verrucomicrobiota bacterium]
MHPKFKNIHRRRSSHSSISGFTLVELLVVIAIIAILASVILAAGSTAIKAPSERAIPIPCSKFRRPA